MPVARRRDVLYSVTRMSRASFSLTTATTTGQPAER